MKITLPSVYIIFMIFVVPFMSIFGGLAAAQAPTDTFVTTTYVPTAMISTTSSSDVATTTDITSSQIVSPTYTDTFTRTSSTQTHMATSPTTTISDKPTQTAGASIMKWDVYQTALGAACGVAVFFIAMA
ncbi:15993_t:CDS:2 [Funneliformis geosporum]|uniref:7134_t:CDS:1 n=1 Tax=Funneliformis geosporum TaxID=1117311 RepID=A0A9W4WQX0_9GLOM|nr:15993_t:CDS:2 [Funneliformis geosporum]CAI2165386.1 7134_t:CDS:2 [Funneliformis geosporum]